MILAQSGQSAESGRLPLPSRMCLGTRCYLANACRCKNLLPLEGAQVHLPIGDIPPPLSPLPHNRCGIRSGLHSGLSGPGCGSRTGDLAPSPHPLPTVRSPRKFTPPRGERGPRRPAADFSDAHTALPENPRLLASSAPLLHNSHSPVRNLAIRRSFAPSEGGAFRSRTPCRHASPELGFCCLWSTWPSMGGSWGSTPFRPH